jgi:hypothetical protein
MSSIDLTKLNNTLGEYCRSNKENLLQSILVDNVSFQNMTPMAGIKDEEPILDLDMGDLIKPYSKTWSPEADKIDAVPRIMKVRTLKVEVELEPLKYEKTYLGHFMKEGTSPENLPFEKFLMDKIAQKAKEQVETQGVFKGIYNSAGTTPADTIDGLNKIVSDEITAANLSPVVTGAITQANAVESLETFFEVVPEEWRETPFKMFVSPQIKHWYNKDYRAKFGAVSHNNEFDKKFIEGTNCEIVSSPGLNGSQRIHLTPAWNIFWGTDLVTDMGNVDVERNHWTLDIMMSFKVGVQIGALKYYWVNDQA